MDRTIDAAAAEQRGIRGVDDGVNAERRDVGDNDFQPRRADLARGEAQAEAAAATATPVPAPTKDPLTVTAYSGQGLRLAALGMPVGYTMTSPIAGTVTVIVYQFVDGEVRSGANLTDRASFPYVMIRSSDREIKLRPGALDKDVQLIVRDGDTIIAGAPLLKIIGGGPSSWATFYDKNVTAQVIASVTAQPAGTGIDPVPVFSR